VTPEPAGGVVCGEGEAADVRARERDAASHVARGTVMLTAAHASLMVAGYVVAVVLARELGPAPYGVYGIVYSVLLATELTARVGIPQSLTRLIAEREETDRRLEGTGFAVTALINLPVFIAFWLAAPWLSQVFNVRDGAVLFRVAALDIPFFGAYFVGSQILNGRQDFVGQAWALAIYAGARVAGVVVLLMTAVTIGGALVVNVAASLTGLGFLVARVGPRSLLPSLHDVRRLSRLAVDVGLLGLGVQLLLNLDLWAVNGLGGNIPGRVKGLYVGAMNLGRVANIFAFVMTSVLIPTVARAAAGADLERIGKATRGGCRFLFVLLVPMAAIAMGNAGDLMALIYSETYREGAPLLFMLVMSHGVLYTIFVTLTSILVGLSFEREAALITIVALFPAAGVTWVLVDRLAAVGATIAALVTMSLVATLAAARVRRHVGPLLPTRAVVRTLLLTALLGAAAALIPSSGAPLLVELVGLTLAYAGLAFAFGLITADDVRLLAARRATTAAGAS